MFCTRQINFIEILYENICSYIDMDNHYWYNINIINIDYKLNKRIDGVEANCVCSAFRINYN